MEASLSVESRLSDRGDAASSSPPAPEALNGVETGYQVKVFSERIWTGAVFCPQRFSHLAIMRCAEYQNKYGCGHACHSAATPEEILALSIVRNRPLMETVSVNSFCLDCGRKKLSAQGKRCKVCAGKMGGRPKGSAGYNLEVSAGGLEK